MEAAPLAQSVAQSKSWFLWAVGGSLLVVLLLAGYRLLPERANHGPVQTASQPDSSNDHSVSDDSPSAPTQSSPRATAGEQKPSTELARTMEPTAPQAVSVSVPEPSINPESTTSSAVSQSLDTEGIAGIESIPLDSPGSYLPYINTQYRHFINYPDGDSGQREMTVAAAGNPGVVTTIELTHSNLYPNDPPGLWIYHYAAREDGLYRISDEDPSQADLYLPNDLAVGKRWKNAVGSFEVTEFDTTITVTGQEFRGVLAYRLRNPELDLDQTTWLAPGYGEVLIKQGSSGSEICRLLGSDPKDPNTVEALVKKHVVNLKKVR